MELRLKELRERRGITQIQLAELTKIGVQNIAKMEQGRSEFFRGKHIDIFCNVLNCNVDDLIKITRV
jgi:DNA-binding Xre family transcriptional regulator